MDEFGDYLAYEGWSEIALAHRERGLSEFEIAEEYFRYAKALVPNGDGSVEIVDRPVGMEFELILSRFRPRNPDMQVLLLWQGEPMVGVQVSIFPRQANETTRALVRSDADGRATLSLRGPGDYLLNAVRIDPATGPGSIVWRSHWASLTFKLP